VRSGFVEVIRAGPRFSKAVVRCTNGQVAQVLGALGVPKSCPIRIQR
jgi:hypothetical protein